MISVIKKLGISLKGITATAGNVLSGKTFYGAGSNKPQIGNMTDKSGTTTSATADINSSKLRLKIPANGYYNTSAYLTCDPGTATAAQVMSGKTFSSTAGVNISGTLALNGDAGAGNVLSGKTFYSNSFTKKTGTMTNNTVTQETTRKTFTPTTSAQEYTIPTGYYSGSNKVKCNAIPVNIKTNSYRNANSIAYININLGGAKTVYSFSFGGANWSNSGDKGYEIRYGSTAPPSNSNEFSSWGKVLKSGTIPMTSEGVNWNYKTPFTATYIAVKTDQIGYGGVFLSATYY